MDLRNAGPWLLSTTSSAPEFSAANDYRIRELLGRHQPRSRAEAVTNTVLSPRFPCGLRCPLPPKDERESSFASASNEIPQGHCARVLPLTGSRDFASHSRLYRPSPLLPSAGQDPRCH
jgi:hypothetical protein